MSDELRAAVKRILATSEAGRRGESARETAASVYGTQDLEAAGNAGEADILAVCRAVAAETDPTPLTVEAVTALLGPPVCGNEWRFGDGGYLFRSDGQARVTWDGFLLIVDTLGDLRTAMRLAGITLPQTGETR
jgi:hypothetical protein